MTDPKAPLEPVVDEVIRLTTWQNIRRYVVLGGIGFVILDLIVTLTVVILLAAATREADKDRATKACLNTASLSLVQRQNVEDQRKSTEDLVKSGDTLGLSKERFNELVKKSRAQQSKFLGALDRLAKADCEDIDSVKPVTLR